MDNMGGLFHSIRFSIGGICYDESLGGLDGGMWVERCTELQNNRKKTAAKKITTWWFGILDDRRKQRLAIAKELEYMLPIPPSFPGGICFQGGQERWTRRFKKNN